MVETPAHTAPLSRRFSVAPMMDWTDRHCRMFHRQLSRHALLYTEMVTADAVIHGDQARLLGFDGAEHPIALQLGGSEPDKLAAAVKIALEFQYDEINLNVGCPSDRVQSGSFGACLMAEPELVADCIRAMQDAAGAVPITVKCRIGIDEQDEEQALRSFVEIVSERGGATSFAVHARKAWLKGLSPKQNREVPPLNYPLVYALKQELPDLEIAINGGIPDLDAVATHLGHVDGAMVGRAAYQTPWVLADVDRRFFAADNPVQTPHQAIRNYLPYVEGCLSAGVPLKSMTRHMMGLFAGAKGARAWRRTLSEQAHKDGAGPEVLLQALSCVSEAPYLEGHAA
ncbi:MAG: tRNA dihydrouridine(20/20a) synthase DusA [Alphaproteobacteria bacterium]